MISRRGVLSGIVAASASVEVSDAQNKIMSVEDQVKAVAMAMQMIHGGEWRYSIDPIARNVFVTQFSLTGEVKKRR